MKVVECNTPAELQNLAIELEKANFILEAMNNKLTEDNKLLVKQIIDECLKNRELKQ